MPAQQSDQQPVMYGIANCDTIKKARNWLRQHDIDYQFHDYKKLGANEEQLQAWLAELGWQQLINRRGTSWRKLDDNIKAAMNNETAVRVMRENPSIIKRPLIQLQDQIIVGFDESRYQQEFDK